MKLSTALRAARHASQLSLREASKLIVVAKSTISTWENEGTSPKGWDLADTAEAYRCSFSVDANGDWTWIPVDVEPLEPV